MFLIMAHRLLFGLLLVSFFFFLLPSPIQAAQTREEWAVSQFKESTLPKEVKDGISDENRGLIQGILKTLSASLRAIFNNPPQEPATLLGQSDNLHQANLPGELKPKSEGFSVGGIINQFQGLLGTSTGFYGSDLPKFKTPIEKVSDFEETYEKVNFPEGIDPITGQQ